MSRMSRGCARCRTRRVKCDEGRPSCQRCIQRNEICAGYRDEATLIFRSENDKAARPAVPRRSASHSTLRSGKSSHQPVGGLPTEGISGVYDPSDLSTAEISSLNLSNSYPWVRADAKASGTSAEDQVVSQFFEKFVMYPCNHGSSPGFLEHLPSLFKEVNVEGRLALRWAVRAAAYASLSNDPNNAILSQKALQCYGLALSALREGLADTTKIPDDHILMTVVVLDLFESIYLHDSVSLGSHSQGMAQILRLRGPNQMYDERSWSLFRLSHHRVQRQQFMSRQGPLPESETWLDLLNDDLPFVRIEKDNFQITKICERARKLLTNIDDSELSAEQTLDLIKEMHELDRAATTWRGDPYWDFKTIHRSEISQDSEKWAAFPEFVQLHQDVWIAYEWNYHRTARIVMHEHLLKCLARFQDVQSVKSGTLQGVLNFLRDTSIGIVRALVDELLSTVPQSLGDIDHNGNVLEPSAGSMLCRGVGGYFLLWPMKISKSTASATPDQHRIAQSVFERIRECTGMKTALGEASNI